MSEKVAFGEASLEVCLLIFPLSKQNPAIEIERRMVAITFKLSSDLLQIRH